MAKKKPKKKPNNFAVILTPKVPSEPPDPAMQSKEIYEVICVRECRETYRSVETVVGHYAVKAVAEFRMNGAKLFQEVGSTDQYFVRPTTLILDPTVEIYAKRVGRGGERL